MGRARRVKHERSTGRARGGFAHGKVDAAEAGRRGGAATAEARRTTLAAYGSILALMDAAGMGGATWIPWRTFWKACYALPMTDAELAIFRRHTERDQPPPAPVAEAWMLIGRGGGKTRNSALHAVYRAITFDSSSVAPGEDVVIPLLASDRRQARQALKYIKALNELPEVKRLVFRSLRERIEYRTGLDIEVVTATKDAPRGYSCPTVACDEIAWWNDGGSNPDHEVVTAVRGSLGRVSGSVLLALSNPYAPRGELHDAHERSFGKDDSEVLVWVADTLSMNPHYDRAAIERAFKRDPVVAMSEFGKDGRVTFRQARQALLDDDALGQVVVVGRRELPPVPGTKYVAFIDAAEGSRSGDSMTLGIAHRVEGGAVTVLDLVREIEPPFNPGEVIAALFAPLLRDYGCRSVTGDRHAVGWVADAFRRRGIEFRPATLTKSELYSELMPLVNTGAVELLDHATLRTQLLTLERRSARGGRDSIDHPRGGHDDVANAAAGAVVLASGVADKPVARMPAFISIGGEHMGTHVYGTDYDPGDTLERMRSL